MIAMICMIIDHVSDNFFPDLLYLRIIGRMAMPMFAFCVAEGYAHTHDRKKYLIRLLLFGILSEVPFDLVVGGKPIYLNHQNIMFTFAWSVLGLMCIDKARKIENNPLSVVCETAVFIVFTIFSLFLGLDYNIVGPVIIFTYYILRERNLWIVNSVAALVYLVFRNVGIYIYGVLGFIPIYLYNGQRGKGLKWLFYLFYPLHLLVIYLIKTMIV